MSTSNATSENLHAPRQCRICGSHDILPLGVVEYFSGYPWQVSDCRACGCRFTRHDDSVHDIFHQSGAISYYAEYRYLAEQTRRLFVAGDRTGLQQHLVNVSPKYRFVIEAAEGLDRGASCLELGCSRGYLSSWLILAGLDVLGVDVSPEAVSAATASFGDHFALADSPRAMVGGPYDLIYHVGLIGCVADPVGLTRSLLEKLKPGGKLIFNTPNRDACWMRDQHWIDTTPPPDLVTLFPPGFWKEQLSTVADVQETIQNRTPQQSVRIWAAQRAGRKWHKPRPQPLESSPNGSGVWHQPPGGRWLERMIAKSINSTGLSRFVPAVTMEFGLYVTLTRRA